MTAHETRTETAWTVPQPNLPAIGPFPTEAAARAWHTEFVTTHHTEEGTPS